MDRNLALVATLAVGALVAFQAPGNALLAREVGDLGAALTSLLISTAIVLVSLITVRSLGAGGVTAALVATQLAVAALSDRFGWVGLDRSPLTAGKLAGVALLLVGTWLVTRP